MTRSCREVGLTGTGLIRWQNFFRDFSEGRRILAASDKQPEASAMIQWGLSQVTCARLLTPVQIQTLLLCQSLGHECVHQ